MSARFARTLLPAGRVNGHVPRSWYACCGATSSNDSMSVAGFDSAKVSMSILGRQAPDGTLRCCVLQHNMSTDSAGSAAAPPADHDEQDQQGGKWKGQALQHRCAR